MPLILLIRHAENDYVKSGRLAGRQAGVHLNAHGKQQAQELAGALEKVPLAAIYSSPLERTQETAQFLADSHNLGVILHPALQEIEIGQWQNRTLKQLRRRKLWRLVQHFPSRMRFPEGESFAEAQLRVVNELESLAAAHAAKQIIACVSHSDLIKLAAAYYLGLPLDLFQRIMIAPASVTTLYLGEGVPRLLHLNHAASLAFKP